jgi:hypothetical protein
MAVGSASAAGRRSDVDADAGILSHSAAAVLAHLPGEPPHPAAPPPAAADNFSSLVLASPSPADATAVDDVDAVRVHAKSLSFEYEKLLCQSGSCNVRDISGAGLSLLSTNDWLYKPMKDISNFYDMLLLQPLISTR